MLRTDVNKASEKKFFLVMRGDKTKVVRVLLQHLPDFGRFLIISGIAELLCHGVGLVRKNAVISGAGQSALLYQRLFAVPLCIIGRKHLYGAAEITESQPRR